MDYVLPYVDNRDPVWRAQYEARFGSLDMDESRFRCFDTLKYAFRGVSVNMPFIDRIVLIVSTESQVPAWVNRDNVRIVEHKDFIPAEYLPTFSSSAIESFLWRLDGLSERFIYGNDDFFALKQLSEDDFWDGDLPRLTFYESDYHFRNSFRRNCRNGMDMVADALGVERTDPWILLKPQHCMKGIRTDHMKRVGELCADKILATITPMRHPWNVTGYIYNYFAYYTREFRPFKATYEYQRINSAWDDTCELIESLDNSIICINDAGDLPAEEYEEAVKGLCRSFEKVLPRRGKFEQG